MNLWSEKSMSDINNKIEACSSKTYFYTSERVSGVVYGITSLLTMHLKIDDDVNFLIYRSDQLIKFHQGR